MASEAKSPDHAAGSTPCPKPGPGARTVLVGLARNALLTAVSVVITLGVVELALRLYHGELTNSSSQLRPSPNRVGQTTARYDAQLGWVPKSGLFERSPGEAWTVNLAGLRSNGSSFSSARRPILVVGDSFTFGDEVLDHETWPAQLEQQLQVPVLNGGVFAYGVDQAFLRASRLLDLYRPEVVLLAFISDNINRAEFSFYSGWKPYFEYVDGELTLKNVPVPSGSGPSPGYATLRRILSYSFLFSALLSRAAPEWWSPMTILRTHDDGETVAVDLFARLQALAEAKDASFLVIALGTNGRIGGNSRTSRVVEQARQRGIDVLNLLPEIEQIWPDSQVAMFKARGHYAPPLNARIAARVAAYLNQVR